MKKSLCQEVKKLKMTHPITVLSEQQQAELKSLKILPAEERAIIVNAIDRLFCGTSESDVLANTGHLDLAAACWAAELLNIDWR